MSLPAAQKDISTKPAAGSVTDPVNKADKDADVARKIKLYGVIEAFRQGRMPDNAQIDKTLQYVIENSPFDTSKLSPEGQKLVQDTRDIISTARTIVQQKNGDELFQQFVWHTRDIDVSPAKKDPNEVVPVDKQKAREDGQQAVQHLRTILHLVLTNSEVRKLLSDFSVIGRDLLARGAAKAADNLRPNDEELSRVNEAGPRDQFVSKDGQTVGPDKTPVLEARIPGTDKTIQQHPKEPLGTGAHVVHGDGTVQSGDSAYQDARRQAEQTANQNKQELNRQIDEAQYEADVAQGDGPEAEEKKKGLMNRVKGLRDGLTDRVPQEHKDKAREHYDRGKTFLSDEYFPEERRDQFIFRGKKVIIECQKHDDYQESISWLLGFLEEYASHARTASGHGKDAHEQLTSDITLRQATREIRTLLERFANGQSMNGIFDAMNQLIDDANQDPELKQWFKDVDAYVRKVLLDAGFVLEPECNNRANGLRESGRKFYDDKYKGHFDNLFNNISGWFTAMGDDPLNKKFGDDWARLTKDLLFDNEGSLKFKKDLWNDIRKVILPNLVDKVGYVPIPRIEYTDDSLDLVVENLTLSGRNLFPNVMSLEAHNFIKFSPYTAITDESHHEFTITFSQMQADMRDVAFYFRKKTGAIKMRDSGLADVVLGGEGLSATVHLVSAGKDRTSVFKVKNVNVKVDSLKFSIRDSKHDLLYKTVKPLATGLVKKQIQKAISDSIKTGLEYVDGQLVGVRDRMEEAKKSDETNRGEVLKELFQRKKDETASKASDATRNSQFKVVSNKRNSILAQEGHPAGWVNRTAEKQDVAGKGHEWRSDAFTIV